MITKKNHAMPCPENIKCYLCDSKMEMKSMSYGGGEATVINWECKCGAKITTKEACIGIENEH